jgi:hypothetical protein
LFWPTRRTCRHLGARRGVTAVVVAGKPAPLIWQPSRYTSDTFHVYVRDVEAEQNTVRSDLWL